MAIFSTSYPVYFKGWCGYERSWSGWRTWENWGIYNTHWCQCMFKVFEKVILVYNASCRLIQCRSVLKCSFKWNCPCIIPKSVKVRVYNQVLYNILRVYSGNYYFAVSALHKLWNAVDGMHGSAESLSCFFHRVRFFLIY